MFRNKVTPSKVDSALSKRDNALESFKIVVTSLKSSTEDFISEKDSLESRIEMLYRTIEQEKLKLTSIEIEISKNNEYISNFSKLVGE